MKILCFTICFCSALNIAHTPERLVEFPILEGKYFGQKPPGMSPERFAPGIISTDEFNEQEVVFSPDGRSLYFTFREGSRKYVTKFMKMENGKWTKPYVPALFRDIGLRYPCVSDDGLKLIFVAEQKATTQGDATNNNDIWIVDILSPGAWGEPVRLGPEVNTPGPERHPTITENGALFFYSSREDTRGGVDIYKSEYSDNRYHPAENIGGLLNGEYAEYNPYVAPDGSFIVVNISGLPDSYGGSDLYISYSLDDGTWSKPKNMGSEINSEAADLKASITPDGKYFFFTSSRKGTMDVYWVDAKLLNTIKPDF